MDSKPSVASSSASSSSCTAPSPASSISSYDEEWMTQTTTAPETDSTGALVWPPGDQGLAISAYPPTDSLYGNAVQPYTMPYSWPSQPLTAGPYPGQFRRASWVEGNCEPRTLPQASAWTASQVAASTGLDYDASPSLSTYSTNSRPSAMSSPYIQAAGSPMIKVEDPSEQHVSKVAYYQGAAEHGHPMHVRPGDLVTEPMDVDSLVVTSDYYSMYEAEQDMIDERDQRTRQPRSKQSVEDFVAEFLEGPKRGYTSIENASCQCEQCGKLFQRTFNLRAHMETHDPHRTQPHQCQFPKCEKRFVRRTDLARHEQSVHIKTKVFRCPLCDSQFARRDTLRRHMGDGCPRRAEVRRQEVRKRGSRQFRVSATPAPVSSPSQRGPDNMATTAQ